jgi:UDP-3-O-[3-hydroxymyristoyl] glucosamine N-acyltransferase
LYDQVTLGDRVILHATAVLGADGFGYQLKNGAFEKIPQLGTVIIEDDVEIGAGTTIDRAMIGATKIGRGTKLDNQIMIGHNCELGAHNVFASQVGLAGSVTTGEYVICGGQVGVTDHVHIGDGARLASKSGVRKDLAGGQAYVGQPVQPERDGMRTIMATQKLPEMARRVRKMESRIEDVAELLLQLNDDNPPLAKAG